jgi:hypothetical protein
MPGIAVGPDQSGAADKPRPLQRYVLQGQNLQEALQGVPEGKIFFFGPSAHSLYIYCHLLTYTLINYHESESLSSGKIYFRGPA